MQNHWYDLFISFSYNVGAMKGTIFIFNPLYALLILLIPGTLVGFKRRLELPKWMGFELWKLGLILIIVLFITGIIWQLFYR